MTVTEARQGIEKGKLTQQSGRMTSPSWRTFKTFYAEEVPILSELGWKKVIVS